MPGQQLEGHPDQGREMGGGVRRHKGAKGHGLSAGPQLVEPSCSIPFVFL